MLRGSAGDQTLTGDQFRLGLGLKSTWILVAPGCNGRTGGTPPAAAAQTTFHAVTPARVVDSRSGLNAPPTTLMGGCVLPVRLAGLGGVPEAGATAVTMNLTVVGATGAGFATAYPCASGRPWVSNLNYGAAEAVPNLVTRAARRGRLRLHLPPDVGSRDRRRDGVVRRHHRRAVPEPSAHAPGRHQAGLGWRGPSSASAACCRCRWSVWVAWRPVHRCGRWPSTSPSRARRKPVSSPPTPCESGIPGVVEPQLRTRSHGGEPGGRGGRRVRAGLPPLQRAHRARRRPARLVRTGGVGRDLDVRAPRAHPAARHPHRPRACRPPRR